MTGEIIKEFLVGLGFEVDDSSLSKFNKSIANAAVKVTALYTAVQAMAAGIVFGITKVSEGFEEIGYQFRIIAPAINKELILRRELLKAYAATGINISQVVRQSVLLNYSLKKTEFAFTAIYQSVAAKFFPLITKQSDIFRDKLYKNLPKIKQALEGFVKFIFKAFEATVQLGARLWSILSRVYDFFVSLDKATNGWSTKILALAAAWQALNLSFLASPLGIVLAGLLAILALYDDFETFKEGGKSFFNWSAAIPFIDAITDDLKAFRDVLDSIFTIIFNLGAVLIKLFHGDFSGAFDNIKDAFSGLLDLLDRVWAVVNRLSGGVIGDAISSIFGSNPQNLAGNIQGGVPSLAAPLGADSQSKNTNIVANYQTSVNMVGTPNTESNGRNIAGAVNTTNLTNTRALRAYNQ